MATAGIAALAGADLGTAARLGLSMLGMQASIGALNDLVDAPDDALQKPAKPIPRGLVSRHAAATVAAVAGAAGLALSSPSGIGTVGVALAGLGLGYLYDLRLSRTPLSWLPLSLALPLLPIHAWLGATGTIPPGLFTLVPAAVLAGAALALANGLVDVERDAHVGRPAAAVLLGPARTWVVHAGLLAIVAAMAVIVAPSPPASLVPAGAEGPAAGGTGLGLDILRALRVLGVWIGVALLAVGAGALGAARAGVRERGWELEAIGVASLGLGWLAGTAAAAGGAVQT
jgi:4-hydroxybenzoate polyprenyltransferase